MSAELEHVPTAAELVVMGPEYAVALDWTKGTAKEPARPTIIRVMGRGHALMGEVMRRNSAALRARGEWRIPVEIKRP